MPFVMALIRTKNLYIARYLHPVHCLPTGNLNLLFAIYAQNSEICVTFWEISKI